jgi:hypothetical protein
MKITITVRQIVAVLIVAVALYLLRQRFMASASVSVGAGDKVWTVYGTMQCGWTRKQLDYFKSNNIPHKFVDCAKGGCNGEKAFPTLVSPSGEKLVGYTEF